MHAVEIDNFPKGLCRIRDARGREVPQLDPMKLHVLRRPGAIESDVLDRIVNELEPGTAKTRPFLIFAVAAGVVLALAGIVASIIMEGQTAWNDLVDTVTNPAIIAPNVFVIAFVPWMVVRKRRSRRGRVSAVMIKHRRCPRCGYSLQGLSVDPADGATVCPECACAWRLDDPKFAARATAADTAAAGVPGRALWLLFAVLGLTVLALLGTFMLWRSMP